MGRNTVEEQDPKQQQSLLLGTHYQVLNVPATASASLIKEAYHAAARSHHPDKRQQWQQSPASLSSVDPTTDIVDTVVEDQDASTFLLIQKAWECLRDAEARKLYDQRLLVQTSRVQRQRQNAIMIHPHECRHVMVPTHKQSGCDNKNNIDNISDEYVVMDLAYTCRCGSEINTADEYGLVETAVTDATEICNLVQCPGCSLVYDVTLLYAEDGDEDTEENEK